MRPAAQRLMGMKVLLVASHSCPKIPLEYFNSEEQQGAQKDLFSPDN
jgi:hypothetical protein